MVGGFRPRASGPAPWRGGLAFVALALFTACGGDDSVEPSVAATISISPSSVDMASFGETSQLTAVVRDQHGQPMAGAPVDWASADASVATVDASGLVTAVRNGSATVTATSGSATGTAAVSVSQVTVGMDVLPAATTLFSLGDTVRLVAAGVDANGHAAAGPTFTWTSENAAVAAVDSTGLVTAVRTGSTDVFAASGELRDSSGVTVAQLASEVRVTPAVDTLAAVGDTVHLSAVALDANGNEVEDTEYIWSAPHPSVVTVDGSGLVTAEGPGTGNIRVKATRAGANHVGVATITVRESMGGT